MDRLIYTAASAARSLMQRQDGLAQNLANANTPGYRAEQVAFRAVPIRGDGESTRVMPVEVTAGFDPRPGAIEVTGRGLDIAVNGEGYIAVQAQDGSEAYTRNGSLAVNAEGVLVAHGGAVVVGEGGSLTIPADAIPRIAADGTVSAQPATGPAQVVGRVKLIGAAVGELHKGLDGLLRPLNGEPLPSDEGVRVVAGSLESSNVSVVDAMVSMIAASRQFEAQMKLLQTAEQNDQRASQLLAPSH